MAEQAGGTIAAVIPAHNAASTLARALRSVQAQTLPVDEVIVVDDHSTDATPDVVGDFAAQDTRVRLVRATARGAGHARNLGVQAAGTDLIAFLDADDVWYPDKLETQLPLLDEDVAFVGGLLHYLGEDGSVLGSYLPFEDWDEATVSLRKAETMPVSLSTGLLRRADFLAAGGFDESFMRTQDLELGQRLVAGGQRVVWPKGRALGGYVLHRDGVSATSYREQFLAAELVRARLRGQTQASYPEWQSDPELTPRQWRRLRSGVHYRKAAVAKGAGDRVSVAVHGLAAVSVDPLGTARKLRMRSRHVGDLEPTEPPSQILAEFRIPEELAPATVDHVPFVEVAGLRLAEDPWLLGESAVRDFVSRPRLLRLYAAHVTSLIHVGESDFVAAFNDADAGYVDGVSWSLIAAAGGERARKVATTDLAPTLLTWLSIGLERPVRIAVLGGVPRTRRKAAVAARAGQALERELPVEVVYTRHGYHDDWTPVLQEVRSAEPDAVLVGLGMPLEAYWGRAYRDQLPPALVLTCGGWLRILAGDEHRAPDIVQNLNLEWLHRLTHDPRRTYRRYAVGSVRLVRHARAARRRARGSTRG